MSLKRLCILFISLGIPGLVQAQGWQVLGSLGVIKPHEKSIYACLEGRELVQLSARKISANTKYRLIKNQKEEDTRLRKRILLARGKQRLAFQTKRKDLRASAKLCKRVLASATPTIEIKTTPTLEQPTQSSPTATASPTSSASSSATPTRTPTASVTSTSTSTATSTRTATATQTPTRTNTPTASATVTPTPASQATATPTRTPTHTTTPTATHTASATATPTQTPTATQTATPNSQLNRLVLNFSLNEGSGGLAQDSSGLGNHGTINSGAWVPGPYGQALQFNGNSTNIQISDADTLDLGNAGTIQAYVSIAGSRWHGVIAKGNANSDAAHAYNIEITPQNAAVCVLGNGSAYISVSSTQTFSPNTYYHLACSWDGASVRLYINGTLVNTITQSLVPFANSSPLFVGQWGNDDDRLLGEIDEVKIYNYARTQAQIQTDMNSGDLGPGRISLDSTTALFATGSNGGPFSPNSITYTLSNVGGTPVSYSISKTQNWLNLSSNSGTLAVGASTNVTISINQNANSLANGSYSDTISFTNGTNGNGNTTRSASLLVYQPGSGPTASAITHDGVRWVFDTARQVGQYVSGDWWVVGPVTVVSIQVTTPGDPQPSCNAQSGKSGSMVNPRFGHQSYDSNVRYSDSSYNVALCRTAPINLVPGDTLVSADSYPGAGYPSDNRYQVRKTAILTVVDVPQPNNVFRPPYTRPTRVAQSYLDPLRFSKDQLKWNLLPKLPVVPSTPPLSETIALFSHTYIDHFESWNDLDACPVENSGMSANPCYGQAIGEAVSEGALQLMLNYSNTSLEPLLIGMVQRGIDLYGSLSDDGEWSADAGIFQGRKWPILYAGIMLDHPGMKNIGTTHHSYPSSPSPGYFFQEDGQTYYYNDPTLPEWVDNQGYPAAPNAQGSFRLRGQLGWIGLLNGQGSTALWRIRDGGGWGGIITQAHEHLHVNNWHSDANNQRKSDAYRRANTVMSWVGYGLASFLVNDTQGNTMKELWNHGAFFDYNDRWMTEDDTAAYNAYVARFGDPGYWPRQGTLTSSFVRKMWETYR